MNKTEEITSVLSNKKLVYESVQSDRDYSGGGWYNDLKITLILYGDKSFEGRKESFSSVSGGGLSLPRHSKETRYGTWSVIYNYPHNYLVLNHENGEIEMFETDNVGTGLQKMGSQTWNRYRLG